MKKLTVIFIFLVMCLSFVGCKNTKVKNNEAKAVLTKVLNQEESFTIYNPSTEKTTVEKLHFFSYPTYYDPLNDFVSGHYTFADFDGDGIEEALVIDARLNYFLFLRYNKGKVYGYIHEDISSKDVKTDGSFMTFAFNGYKAISRISFSGTSFKVTDKAYKDDSKNEYFLNGKPATKEEVEKCFEDWEQNTTVVSWQKMS